MSVELASATLVVAGAIALFGTLTGLPDAIGNGSGALAIAAAALYLASIVVGLLIRFGRLWVVAINYVAVLGFLYFLAAANGDQVAALLALADVFVISVLFAQRTWFGR